MNKVIVRIFRRSPLSKGGPRNPPTPLGSVTIQAGTVDDERTAARKAVAEHMQVSERQVLVNHSADPQGQQGLVAYVPALEGV